MIKIRTCHLTMMKDVYSIYALVIDIDEIDDRWLMEIIKYRVRIENMICEDVYLQEMLFWSLSLSFEWDYKDKYTFVFFLFAFEYVEESCDRKRALYSFFVVWLWALYSFIIYI